MTLHPFHQPSLHPLLPHPRPAVSTTVRERQWSAYFPIHRTRPRIHRASRSRASFRLVRLGTTEAIALPVFLCETSKVLQGEGLVGSVHGCGLQLIFCDDTMLGLGWAHCLHGSLDRIGEPTGKTVMEGVKALRRLGRYLCSKQTNPLPRKPGLRRSCFTVQVVTVSMS